MTSALVVDVVASVVVLAILCFALWSAAGAGRDSVSPRR